MVEKLRKRYIIVSMLAILAVMACIVGAICAVNIFQRNSRSDEMLRYIADRSGQLDFPPDRGAEFPAQDGAPPPSDDDSSEYENSTDRNSVSGGADYGTQGSPDGNGEKFFPGNRSINIDAETPFRTRFFSVTYSNGDYIGCDVSHVAAITENEARDYGDAVIDAGSDSGTKGGYRFLVTGSEDTAVIYFLDISEEVQASRSYLRGSLLVAGISYLVIFVLIYFISKAAVRPIAANIENQKRFITDAEHEIKTPLAIISANAEVLEMLHGKSEWTSNIRDQVKRSSDLVQRLLILSKMDGINPVVDFSDFSISDAVLETVAPFGAVASSAGKVLLTDIQPGLSYRGDERSIRELVSILTDNAVKYCSDGGTVSVSLSGDEKKIILRTENDVTDGSSIETEQLFDRFYRGDESRSRDSGGYGIGLSIARAVTDAHHGSIQAKTDGKKILFTVTL